MLYNKTVYLKNSKACVLRNGTEQDGQAVFDLFLRTHGQTDFLLSYPEENSSTPEQERLFLKTQAESGSEIELLAEMDGTILGSAGIRQVGNKEKVRHRAEFGISVDQDFWGLGIGRALTEACIQCAREAGYAQLELEVVADNSRALSLYTSLGFVEYGRNPRGFRSRLSGWQEIVLMRLEL